MTTAPLRQSGAPSPIELGTHDDADLRPAIPFDAIAAARHAVLDLPDAAIRHDALAVDQVADADTPLTRTAGLIRPFCVGALMAIPTIGTATVGLVALFSEARALAMVRASTAFLAGLPTDVVVLIGTLATGYGLARTVEKVKGAVA